MSNFLLISSTAIMGILAQLSRNREWLIWILRTVIFITGLLEFVCLITASLSEYTSYSFDSRLITILTVLFPINWLILFMPIRQLLSWLFTGLDLIITGQIFLPLIRKKLKATTYFREKKIFIPNSITHLVALFVYIIAAAYLFTTIKTPASLNVFLKPVEPASPFEQFLSFNGIGLILLSFCGIGLWIFRSGKEALQRLDLTHPTLIQIAIGFCLIFVGFFYDGLWACYMHRLAGQDLATELSYYNSATFTMAGSFIPSVILALFITACAGIGEEILFRGALQPVFGILPSALLHGILHAQIAHAPIFIVKVTIWSLVMGLFRRYLNTTTTAIAHAGFNMVTILLFAANP